LVKSIAQMYPEAVWALRRRQYGRQNPLASLRLQADLHMRFWLPIAEILDPLDRTATPHGPGLEFYARGSMPLSPDGKEQSLAHMKRYLGTPQLTYNIWLQIRPIFRNLLSDAMTKDDSDLVACAAREFVRLSLGQPADPAYGLVDFDPSAIYLDGPWYDRSDVADWFCLHDESQSSWSDCDWMICFATKALQNILDDPDAFVKEFPGCARHRLNMLRALRPIFDHASVTNWWITEEVLPYVKALLAIDFGEAGPASISSSVVAEVD
jgi:hypothetical protein